MLKANTAAKRSFILGLLMSTLFWAIAAHAQDQSSATFSSKEGAFSVLLPSTPKETAKDINSNNGPTTLHSFMVETGDGSLFLVGYSDYQTNLDVDGSLSSVINGQVESLKGKITADKLETLDGHSGRSVTIENDEAIFLSKVYVAGARLYQVMYGAPKKAASPEKAKEFFDSFRILM